MNTPVSHSQVEKAFFILLRAGLWGNPPDDLSVFPLTANQWEELYAESCRQTVQGLVFEGLRQLPHHLAAPTLLIAKWLLAVNEIAATNKMVNAAVKRLSTFYNGNAQAAPFMLKGQSLAEKYPIPLRRVSGDIDLWYCTPSAFSDAVMLVKARKLNVQTDTDLDIHFTLDGVLVECHRTWIQVFSPSSVKKLEKLAADIIMEHPSEPLSSLPPLLDILMLNLHILKHALVMGIGWRQLCDMAMAYQAYSGKYDPDELLRIVKTLGLYRWTLLLDETLVKMLKMPAGFLPFTDKRTPDVSSFVKVIRSSGDMGLHSTNSSYMQLSGRKKNWYLLERVFTKLSFSLKYAPVEMFWRLFYLTRNKISYGN